MKGIFVGACRKWLALLFLPLTLLVTSTSWAEEKIDPNEIGEWIVDGFAISMRMECSVSIYDFWPEKYCKKPYVEIGPKINRDLNQLFSAPQYFKLVAGSIELGDKWMFDGNDDPQRRVPLSEITLGRVKSEDLLNLLLAKPGIQIKFMTRAGQGQPTKSRTIVLSGFDSYAKKTVQEIDYRYSMEVSEARKNKIIALAAFGGFLVVAFLLARFLIRRARSKIKVVKQNLETKRVSRVAEDEAIREVVRNSVQKAENQSLEVLKDQIKKALDAGDTKAAEELLKIMNHLNSN
ncbi:MAG: hypothetical protein E6Q34_06580 [Burkholderiaceae bacterium]|nr:MAG: hypothetical protein E6Q34_06580 [Burkholderiaceae bacterium]